MKRKDFLVKTGIACVGVSLLPTVSCTNSKQKDTKQIGSFELPELGYPYDALEPAIDARTMEIHHSKHHAGYVKKLNKALENHQLKGQNIESICKNVTAKDKDTAVLNNAGGHYNHSLFWEVIKPGGSKNPEGDLMKRIKQDFGSYSTFEDEFSKAASSVFGSGWAWLITDNKGKLSITATENQENPLMENVVDQLGTPILGIDVWEHAYYLHYKNKRTDYISNFMSIINWDMVADKYQSSLS
ncbi:Fe-Mn family superoxide dismutase [Balneicella halophila]|uniref:Superoxide dismutase n=1 Tax=Balneicella halophila TaxID=1537566 RepID=A0A7L4UMR1_BALHA|nr:superoxide dismutase [Balneicella halophila]PVX49914.1 Fe-Mn family superoxide dismutase [Balneicella halophila]